MKDNLYTLFYAAALGVVCAVLLTGVGHYLAPLREANAKAEEVRNILRVLGITFDPKNSAQDLVEVFEGKVRREPRGDLLVYLYMDTDKSDVVRAAAVPFSGQGLWGLVKGFLALEPDMRTIRGITFYEHEETPGLGGEIASSWFQDQFKGKSIEDAAGNPGIHMRIGGGASAPNEVDGITGATMTCEKVEKMLNLVIEKISEKRSEHGQ